MPSLDMLLTYALAGLIVMCLAWVGVRIVKTPVRLYYRRRLSYRRLAHETLKVVTVGGAIWLGVFVLYGYWAWVVENWTGAMTWLEAIVFLGVIFGWSVLMTVILGDLHWEISSLSDQLYGASISD